ncbi:uncharacterized protein LOC111794368 [Cucurbita pepo subsp. pepo]|uniref:uncharacterized protein LOC111794368 n=1 Tax=Cucurbita pepo subsp. pepo TaxID=3664 RepID=UPI000C9DA3DC|nr:uncharacterized protein LOC111794368 [Cucurbita pepo subsp. pepo]
MLSTIRAFAPSFNRSQSRAFSTKTQMDSITKNPDARISRCASNSISTESRGTSEDTPITLQEWQGWGSTSPMPTMVTEIIEELKALEKNIDAQMSFGGNGGKLQGYFKTQEDKKHRATYQALGSSEQKLQFFSARQIACRLLGSRDYLCQKCWLPFEDCMCSRVKHCPLWSGARFWLYMHPKDFLRQNNTGKLLLQVFGVEATTLCLYGISEHEDFMWSAFKSAGKSKVCCLYPNKNATSKSVQEAFSSELSTKQERTQQTTDGDGILNFILIDGTWSNSAAMFNRLREQAKSVWGEDLPCISLTTGSSAMHKLRPQPSWDRTCTAAAAASLLFELQLIPRLSSVGLEKQGEALEDSLEVLLEALTSRRIRMGRSITRKVRHATSFC